MCDNSPLSVMSADDPDRTDVTDRRKIGKKIDANRGLTPRRPTDFKTPRTKNREKYRKKEIKRRSQVQEYKGSKAAAGAYGGEKTGIKKSTVKSTKL